jgi:hypothetical protein
MNEKPFIGKMDKLVHVVLYEKTRDDAGGVITQEIEVCSPFAYMKEVSGEEDPDGKLRHLVNRTYTVRYNPKLLIKTTQLYLKDDCKVFEVYHIKEIGRKSHLEILCKLNV